MPVSVTRSYRPGDPTYNKIQKVLSLVGKVMSLEPKDLFSKELQDLRAAAKKLESIRSQGEEAGKMMSQSSQQQNNKMKKIAADRNYRMFKKARLGDQTIPHVEQPELPKDEMYESFKRDIKSCLESNSPNGFKWGDERTDATWDCQKKYERSFSKEWKVENSHLTFENIQKDYWLFLNELGVYTSSAWDDAESLVHDLKRNNRS